MICLDVSLMTKLVKQMELYHNKNGCCYVYAQNMFSNFNQRFAPQCLYGGALNKHVPPYISNNMIFADLLLNPLSKKRSLHFFQTTRIISSCKTFCPLYGKYGVSTWDINPVLTAKLLYSFNSHSRPHIWNNELFYEPMTLFLLKRNEA